MISLKEGKETQFKGRENISNKITEGLKKEMPMKVQEAHGASNRTRKETP